VRAAWPAIQRIPTIKEKIPEATYRRLLMQTASVSPCPRSLEPPLHVRQLPQAPLEGGMGVGERVLLGDGHDVKDVKARRSPQIYKRNCV
jgi:hypothetical protein